MCMYQCTHHCMQDCLLTTFKNCKSTTVTVAQGESLELEYIIQWLTFYQPKDVTS